MDAPTQEPESIARRRTNYLWIEMGVVLLVCVVPLIFNSEADMFGLLGNPRPISFVYQASHSLVSNAGQIALVLFVIWRSGDPPTRFGLRPFKFGRDLFGGILIFAILRVAHYATWWSLRTFLSPDDYRALMHSGTGSFYSPPSGTSQFALLAVMCLASGFTQELVMRSYLIVRFEELLGSTPVAFLLSTILFICYHGYQGAEGVVGVAVFGLIQGVIFCLFRRLAPIALAHAFNNFIAIGNIPWL